MNKKELELYVKKASENVFKKLAENPEEMLNLIDLQEKYNNLLKEKIELKRQIKKQKEVIDKINIFLNNHDKNAGKLYYKYNNKYLLSEIKEDIRNILKEVE